MPTRLTLDRPRVVRTVPATPRTVRSREIVVAVEYAPGDALIVLREIGHRTRYSVPVGRLFDSLAYKEAMRVIAERKKARRKGERGRAKSLIGRIAKGGGV